MPKNDRQKKSADDLNKNISLSILQAANDAILGINPGEEILFFNTKAEALLGYKTEEVLGKNLGSILPQIILSEDLHGSSDNLQNFSLQRKDGSSIPVEASIGKISTKDQILFTIILRRTASHAQVEGIPKDTEKLFLKIFESSPIGVNIFRVSSFSPFAVNDAFLNIVGYSREEFEGRPIDELDLFTDAEIGDAWMNLLRQGEDVYNQEVQIRSKSGEIKNILASLNNVEINDEPMVLVIASDITESKLVKKALSESEDRFRSMVENAPDTIFIQVDQKFAYINPAGCRLFNIQSPREILGTPILDRISPENRIKALERIRRLNINRESVYELFEHPFLRMDGSKVWVETSGAPIVYNGNNGAIVFVRDISQRKEAEAAINRQSRILQLFVENAPAAIAMFDKEMRYISASRRFLVDYEITNEDIIGKSHYEVFPDIPEHWREIHRRCLAGAIERCDEDPFLRANGKMDWIRWEIRPWYETPEKIGGIILFSEVITDHIKNRERIQTQLHRLKILHDIDLAILASSDIKTVLDVLLEAIISSLNIDAASLLLYNPTTNMLIFTVERGFRSQREEKLSISLGKGFAEGLAGGAALERKTRFVPDINKISQKLIRKWLISEEDFVSYFGVPLFVKGNLKGVLEIFHRTMLNPDREWLDFLDALAGQTAIAIDSAQVNEGLRRANLDLTLAYDATIEGWSRAMDLRDRDTEDHTKRVTDLTLRLARQMGIKNDDLVHIRRGCLLHDIGKLGVPDEILLKPAKLTDEEWIIMRQHPQMAFDMISPIEYLRPALDIPFCHHEKWDGTGYPRGLKAGQIPLSARIFAVVDVWDALQSDRPYRNAWKREEVLEYIRSLSGSHFDPLVVQQFLDIMNQ